MAGASNKDGAQFCGLNAREVELTIKAMITVLESGGKPDFERLSQMTQYNDAHVANKNWNFVKRKLQAAGSKNDGEASGNNKTGGETGGDKAGGKKRGGKRQAVDASAQPAPKRTRVRKSVDDDEEKAPGVKVEADENLGDEA